MKLYAAPGTEKWVRWAKFKLGTLVAARTELRLPSLTKTWVPESGTKVVLKSTELADYIWIFGGVILRYLYALDLDIALTLTSVTVDFSGGYANVGVGHTVTTNTINLLVNGVTEVLVASGTVSSSQVAWYRISVGVYESYVPGTQPVGAVGVGTSSTTTYSSYPDNVVGFNYDVTTGTVVTALDDTGTPVVVGSDTTVITTIGTDLGDYGHNIVEEGMANAAIKLEVTDGHPTFTPPPDVVFADGEKITVVEIKYAYDGYNDGFPDTRIFTTITGLSIVKARQYQYTADGATWAFVKELPLFEQTDGVWGEVELVANPVEDYFGNVVIVSENPLTKQGTSSNELETTYRAQMAEMLLPPDGDTTALDAQLATATTNRNNWMTILADAPTMAALAVFFGSMAAAVAYVQGQINTYQAEMDSLQAQIDAISATTDWDWDNYEITEEFDLLRLVHRTLYKTP